jgi:hypothetical protein
MGGYGGAAAAEGGASTSPYGERAGDGIGWVGAQGQGGEGGGMVGGEEEGGEGGGGRGGGGARLSKKAEQAAEVEALLKHGAQRLFSAEHDAQVRIGNSPLSPSPAP